MLNLLWGALLLPYLAETPESAEKAPPKTVTVYALTVAGGG
ncbi:MAG: hypothetical protein ACF8XB_19945 [Planctomycetota bacterium JB042]